MELRLFLIGKNMDFGGFSRGVNRGKSGFVLELSFSIYSRLYFNFANCMRINLVFGYRFFASFFKTSCIMDTELSHLRSLQPRKNRCGKIIVDWKLLARFQHGPKLINYVFNFGTRTLFMLVLCVRGLVRQQLTFVYRINVWGCVEIFPYCDC